MEGFFASYASIFVPNIIVTITWHWSDLILPFTCLADWVHWMPDFWHHGIAGSLDEHWDVVYQHVGMLSINNFCQVFFPFSYAKYCGIVVKVLVNIPWVVTHLSASSLSELEPGKVTFHYPVPHLFHPGRCHRTLCYSFVSFWFVVSVGVGCVLPVASDPHVPEM